VCRESFSGVRNLDPEVHIAAGFGGISESEWNRAVPCLPIVPAPITRGRKAASTSARAIPVAENDSSLPIAERIRRGDRTAEADLYRSALRGVRLVLRKHLRNGEDVDDLAHETFVQVLTRLRSAPLENPEGVLEFVRGWARHLAWNHNRRRSPEPLDPVELDTLPEGAPQDPELVSLLALRRDRLWLAVDALGEADREIIGLLYRSDLDPAEAAARLGIQPKTLYVRKCRALKRLALLVQAMDEADRAEQAKKVEPVEAADHERA
jgi:RNA polymerase sigma factor (sigma-70 family)